MTNDSARPKIIGVVPARMASSRFPGKPLFPICGMTMVEHVFHRALKFPRWTDLVLTTCDEEIAAVGKRQGWPVVMTSSEHKRALDRVAEAVAIAHPDANRDDIVVCVQGDEPMLHPDMIAASIAPLEADETVSCTVLAMDIVEEAHFHNPDVVKIVHDVKGDVLYTSRAPIPYCKTFPPAILPKRIYGILAFRRHFLGTFNALPESPLEIAESCDSNRIMDRGFRQRIAPFPYCPSFAVDTPEDSALVEAHMKADPLWGSY
jgi:3-deoxy-manno-octulosonate cytidylyltransferase (CMP-KDO synthetase)